MEKISVTGGHTSNMHLNACSDKQNCFTNFLLIFSDSRHKNSQFFNSRNTIFRLLRVSSRRGGGGNYFHPSEVPILKQHFISKNISFGYILRTDYLKRSFSYSGAILWNNLPEDIRTSNSSGFFKRSSHRWFSDQFSV